MEIDLSERGMFWCVSFSVLFSFPILNYLTIFFFFQYIIFCHPYSCLVYLGPPYSLFLLSSFVEKVEKFSVYILFPKSHKLNSMK